MCIRDRDRGSSRGIEVVAIIAKPMERPGLIAVTEKETEETETEETETETETKEEEEKEKEEEEEERKMSRRDIY